MSAETQYLISKDNGKLQLPYAEYETLMEKLEESKRVMQVKAAVLADLQRFMEGKRLPQKDSAEQTTPEKAPAPTDSTPPERTEKVSLEFSADGKKSPSPAPAPARSADVEIPPVKKEVAAHFNTQDDSGRLFNVFKQYYTCLNDSCGGTVRVTMKDGVCSLWNYDEWEEFAFVDIFDGNLRFAVDPRYTDELSSLNFCEVPRLLSSRRNLVCIQLGDLNKTMLKVLTKAFNEVGLATS